MQKFPVVTVLRELGPALVIQRKRQTKDSSALFCGSSKMMHHHAAFLFAILAVADYAPNVTTAFELPNVVRLQKIQQHLPPSGSSHLSLQYLPLNHQHQQRQRHHANERRSHFGEPAVKLSQRIIGSDDNEEKTITGVTLKLAFDAAWGVADLSEHKSERFTCDESLDMVHRLRRDSHAVLVGRTTVERDDCTLTVRRGVEPKPELGQPVRIILDPNLSLDLTKYRIFHDGLRTLVFHCNKDRTGKDEAAEVSSKSKVSPTTITTTLQEYPDVSLIYIPPANIATPSPASGRLSPKNVIQHLAEEYDIHHVMVEGGPETARLFLQQKPNLVDRAILVFAPFCFKEPLASHMTRQTFQDAGLELVYEGTQGADRVEHWSRGSLPWPMSTTSTTRWP